MGKTLSIYIPHIFGLSSASAISKTAVKERRSEPLKQICDWEHNNVQIDHVREFVRALLRNLDAMETSVCS